MKFFYAFLVCTFFFIATSYTHQSHQTSHEEKQKWLYFLHEFTWSNGLSFCTGTCIGAATKKIDNKFSKLWPVTWLCAALLNTTFVKETSEMMKKHNIEHSPRLMVLSSWLGSWIGYLIIS